LRRTCSAILLWSLLLWLATAAVVAPPAAGQVDSVSALVADLSSADPEMRLRAVRELGIRAAWEAADPLVPLLADPEADVRKETMDSLEQIGEGAVDSVLQGLTSETPVIRAGCAETLGRLAYIENEQERIARGLLSVAKDPIADVRVQVAASLGSLADPGPETFEALKHGLTDSDFRVRVAAAVSLAGHDDPSGLSILLAAARSKDSQMRAQAASGLSHISAPAAIQALIDLAGDENDDIRQGAYVALLGSGTPNGVAAGLSGLKDPAWRVRREVARVLGMGLAPGAADALLETIHNDQSASVRATAALSLGLLGEKRATETLLGMLSTDHRDMERASAAQALGLLRCQEAIKPLTELLDDQDGRVRHDARQALQMILEDCPDCPK
jgi:HEAT repeat protein